MGIAAGIVDCTATTVLVHDILNNISTAATAAVRSFLFLMCIENDRRTQYIQYDDTRRIKQRTYVLYRWQSLV